MKTFEEFIAESGEYRIEWVSSGVAKSRITSHLSDVKTVVSNLDSNPNVSNLKILQISKSSKPKDMTNSLLPHIKAMASDRPDPFKPITKRYYNVT